MDWKEQLQARRQGSAYRAAEVTGEVRHFRSSGYRGIRDDRAATTEQNLRRDWNRHPEIRARYRGDFEAYRRSQIRNTTFG